MKPETVVVNYVDQATTGEYLDAGRWTTIDGTKYSAGSFLRMVEKKYGSIDLIRGTQIFIKPQKIYKTGKIALRHYCLEMVCVNHGLMGKVKDIVRKQNPSRKPTDEKIELLSEAIDESLAKKKLSEDEITHVHRLIKILKNFMDNQILNAADQAYYGKKLHQLEQQITSKNPVIKKGDIILEIVENPQRMSPAQEKLWRKAKSIVKKNYAQGRPYSDFTKKHWTLVNGIYRNMQEEEIKLNPSTTDADIEAAAQHELEHTDNINLAKQIALDHLQEDPCYYEKLKLITQKNPRSRKRLWPQENK